jgi:hypothetical protein
MSAAIDHGYLPAGKYVINHDIMNCTADGVAGNHLYSGRALGLSEPWDIIQLHPELKPMWNDISEHYSRIGLSHSKNVLWDIDLKKLGSYIGHQPSVFFYGPDESKYWGDHYWLESVEYINSKNNFIYLADELGVDVPETHCFESKLEIDSNVLSEIVFPCYVKAAVSVSGVGIYRCENEDSLTDSLEHFHELVPLQIQEEVNTDIFLNLQYRVIGNDVVRLAASEQILSGFAHQGNRFPASHEPWSLVDPMAHWLHDRGMKGIFAFDIAVIQTDRGLRFKAIECNPRFNGASYPSVIAQKMDIPEWSAVTMKTRHRRLSDIDLREIEFDMKTGEGAIIVNWGTVLTGKLVVMMAGSRPYQDALSEELAERL